MARIQTKSSEKKSQRNRIQNIFFLPIVIFLLVFSSLSFLSMKMGDMFLAKDSLAQSEILYRIAQLTNPFSARIQQRLLGVRVIREERRTHSEETDGDDVVSIGNKDSYVLGASVSVPVLMYHYIRVNQNPNDKVGYNLSVTPDNFRAQMDYLATHGYHTVSLDEMGAALLSHAQLPSRPIVITFDDGYVDCHDSAFPILQSHNFKAVSFVITGLVGGPGYLSWGQIDEMKNSGVFTFDSHTITHRALNVLDNASIKKEVTESKNTLQSHLLYPINWFAYPYGKGAFDSRVSSIVQQAGYVGAFGTNNGSTQSTDYMFRLPRIRVGGSDTLASFAAKIP